MKKFQVIFRANSCPGIVDKRIYVSAPTKAVALQTAKTELNSRGYVNGFVICAVNSL